MEGDGGAQKAAGPSREARAQLTRRRMMEAACRVFTERGYGRTTMEQVAAEAGVAVQTLYFTFHSKPGLLQAAFEHAVLGPDPVPPQLSDWWRAAEREPDVVATVAHVVRGTAVLLGRAAALVWAVAGDLDARPTYEANERMRIEGNAVLVAVLVRKHPLRPGLSQARARDLLLTLTGPHVYHSLVNASGWSVEAYRRWAQAAVLRELFGIDPTSARATRT